MASIVRTVSKKWGRTCGHKSNTRSRCLSTWHSFLQGRTCIGCRLWPDWASDKHRTALPNWGSSRCRRRCKPFSAFFHWICSSSSTLDRPCSEFRSNWSNRQDTMSYRLRYLSLKIGLPGTSNMSMGRNIQSIEIYSSYKSIQPKWGRSLSGWCNQALARIWGGPRGKSSRLKDLYCLLYRSDSSKHPCIPGIRLDTFCRPTCYSSDLYW